MPITEAVAVDDDLTADGATVGERLMPGGPARARFAELRAAGLDDDAAMDTIIREAGPDCTDAEQLGRLSWHVGWVMPLDGVPSLGRLVLFILATEADYGVPPSSWDDLAKVTSLSRCRFESLVGHLVAAGTLRVADGQLTVESSVTPGLVEVHPG